MTVRDATRVSLFPAEIDSRETVDIVIILISPLLSRERERERERETPLNLKLAAQASPAWASRAQVAEASRLLCLPGGRASEEEWAPRTFENDQSILLTGKRGGRGERERQREAKEGERSHCLERGGRRRKRGRSTTNQTLNSVI